MDARRRSVTLSIAGGDLALIAGLALCLAISSAIATDAATASSATEAVAPDPRALETDANVSDSVSVYAAPDRVPPDAAAIEAGIENGTFAPATTVTLGETLVVAVGSAWLASAMAAGNGSPTERFLDALRGDAAFRITQTNPTPMRQLVVAPVGRDNVTVRRAGTTTYVLVDTGALDFRHRASRTPATIHGGERFAVEFGDDLPERSHRFDPAGPVIELRPLPAAFATPAESSVSRPLSPKWIRRPVAINVSPEESLAVRLSLATGRTITERVEPGEVPGTRDVWLDLRGIEPGTAYELELVHDGEVVDRNAGTIREPRARLANATLFPVENGTAVRVTARLSHGGTVRVLSESCETVGSAAVDPGVERRLSIDLRDGDGERLRVRPDDGTGLLVRAHRERGASAVVYPGATAATTIGFDATCEAPTPPQTPTSGTPPTRTSAADRATATQSSGIATSQTPSANSTPRAAETGAPSPGPRRQTPTTAADSGTTTVEGEVVGDPHDGVGAAACRY